MQLRLVCALYWFGACARGDLLIQYDYAGLLLEWVVMRHWPEVPRKQQEPATCVRGAALALRHGGRQPKNPKNVRQRPEAVNHRPQLHCLNCQITRLTGLCDSEQLLTIIPS